MGGFPTEQKFGGSDIGGFQGTAGRRSEKAENLTKKWNRGGRCTRFSEGCQEPQDMQN